MENDSNLILSNASSDILDFLRRRFEILEIMAGRSVETLLKRIGSGGGQRQRTIVENVRKEGRVLGYLASVIAHAHLNLQTPLPAESKMEY
jgi:hypothetical protein